MIVPSESKQSEMLNDHHGMWTCKFSWCGLISVNFKLQILWGLDASLMVRAKVVSKFLTGLVSAVGATVVEVHLPAHNELAMTLSR